MYFPNAASGNEWNRMATLSIRFYSLHPWVHCVLYKFVVFEIFVVEESIRNFNERRDFTEQFSCHDILFDIVPLGTNKVEEISHLDLNGLVGRTSEVTPLAVVIHIAQTVVVASLQKKVSDGGRKLQAQTCSNAIVECPVGVFAILIDNAVGTM